MICTHYEADHVPGLTGLLCRPGRYDNVIIYDRGWPGGGLDDMYRRYLRAINGRDNNGPIPGLAHANRRRVTSAVLADGAGAPPIALGLAAIGQPAMPIGGFGAINAAPNWLLTAAAPAEILWNGVPGGAPAGAPTITCIAVNRYVRTPAGGITGAIGGLGLATNAMSLAFEVRFNNFRYYIGGDIEAAQEDEIKDLLNPNDDAAGRVIAIKASHHGANTATARDFVDQLRPEAAFISCGNQNTYPHPATETVNVLDGYPALAALHAPPPPEPECRPIRHYLTGYAAPGPPPVAYAGSLAITSGDPTVHPPVPGTVRVTVTQAQSVFPSVGSTYLAVQEVVRQVAANANLAGSVAPLAAIGPSFYAAEVALSYGVSDTAKGVVSTFGFPLPIQTAVKTAAGGVYNSMPAVVAQTVTTAAIAAGVPAAIAAAAGAAAGTRRGLGRSISAQNSVREALIAAGRPAGLAAHEALLAANAVTAACPATGQFTVTIFRFHTNNEEDYIHM